MRSSTWEPPREELQRVIGILESELQVKPEQQLMPIQPGMSPGYLCGIDRARTKLGFQPLSLLSGDSRFIQWYWLSPLPRG